MFELYALSSPASWVAAVIAALWVSRWWVMLGLGAAIGIADFWLSGGTVFPPGDAVHVSPLFNAAVQGLVVGAAAFWCVRWAKTFMSGRGNKVMVGGWKIRLDARALVVSTGLLLACLIAAVLGKSLKGTFGGETDNLLVSFYASWTEDVIFFSLVGLSLAFMTFRNPTDEDLFQRASILFSGASGAVIQYNTEKIKKLACYSPCATRVMRIIEYDDNVKAYKINVTTTYQLRNLFHDTSCADNVKVGFDPDVFAVAPPGGIGRLESIKVGGLERLHRVQEISAAGYETEVNLDLDAGETKEFMVEITAWVAVGKEQSLLSQRFVELFEMSIENKCVDVSPRLTRDGDNNPVVLLPNNPVKLPAARSVNAMEKVFSITFLAPTP